jgi:hypothetical protein
MRTAVAAWTLLATLAGATAGATVLIPTDLGDLSREAVAIVRGRVVAVDARWTPGRRGIETLVTVEAEAYLKGALGPLVQVRVPGGRLGRSRNLVVGAPEFAPGQRVVLFLGGRPPALPHIVGLGQGVYRVSSRDAGWFVTPAAVLPAAASAGPVRIVRGDPARGSMSLATFEAQVRALAEATP